MSTQLRAKPTLVHVGCGSKIHSDWINIDFSRWEAVRQAWPWRMFIRKPAPAYFLNHDLRRGIPVPSNTAEAVYGAQFLEHLDRSAVGPFLAEILRVLKPGGVVRLAVPDLEQVVRCYLSALDARRRGATGAVQRYEWAMHWLFDQMVRTRCGGEMSVWLEENRGSPLLREIGGEIERDSFRNPPTPTPPSGRRKFHPRAIVVQKVQQLFAPKTPADTGELHRWMYDDASLRDVLEAAGFRDVRRVNFDESRIARWKSFGFDVYEDGAPRQPGSLWMEAIK